PSAVFSFCLAPFWPRLPLSAIVAVSSNHVEIAMRRNAMMLSWLIPCLIILASAEMSTQAPGHDRLGPLFIDGGPPKDVKESQVILLKRIEGELTKKKYALTKEGRDFLLKQLGKSADIIISDVKKEKFTKQKVEETEKNLKKFVNDLLK